MSDAGIPADMFEPAALEAPITIPPQPQQASAETQSGGLPSIAQHDVGELESDQPIPADEFQSFEDYYETPGQLAKTAAEGVAEGVLGPIATGAERLLGVDPQEMLNRREVNPGVHGTGQALGLGASLFIGTGEAQVAAKLGTVAKEAVGLGKLAEEASILSKIGAEAIDQGAQMALFQGSDEISKMIINDPEATAQNAIANIGLSTALGGALGAGIGAISPLFKSTIAQPMAKTLEDMKARWNFRQQAGDVVETASKEFQDIANANAEVRAKLYSDAEGGLRGEVLSKAMPELSEKSTQLIRDEAQAVSDRISKAIVDMRNNAKIGNKVSSLEQDLIEFQTKVTAPEAQYADTFNAIDDLKKTLQGYSKYSHTGAAESEFALQAKKLAGELRPTLENEAVWGKAAGVQRDINKSISEFINTEKDVVSKFMTKVGGESVFDPAKMNTYFNQIGKPNAEIRQEVLKNYLDKSEALANNVNRILTDAGLEPQARQVSTNVLRDSLGEKTQGAKIIDALIGKEMDKVLGKSAGAGVGAAAAGPWGALAGEHILGTAFTKVLGGLTRSIVENPTSAAGFKSAVDFTIAAAKGQTALNKAINSVFKTGAVSAVSAINQPSAEERAKLDKLVTKAATNSDVIMKINNGNIAHYLPNHQSSLSETNARAVQYLQTLKPHPYRSSPLDKEIEPTSLEKARYDRALDIAQAPASVLNHIKSGTLQASDVQDLNSMYPALYQQMVGQLSNQITNMQGAGQHIPYKTRMSLSLFMGQPLDSSMQPASIQAAQPLKQPQAAPLNGKNGSTKELGKMNNSYMTPLQSSQSHKMARSSK